MILNSILSLIIISPEDICGNLVSLFSEQILRATLPERYNILKLRILSNLFHGLISTSRQRFPAYIYLIKCSIAARNLQFLQMDLESIKRYLKAWQSTTEESQVLYRLLFEATAQMNDSKNALKFITQLLGTYTKETASKSRDDAHK